ncbi:MAG: hypothetical protein NT030_02880, partial [Candidatus Saganbacteria bacterium]|nr:hypothetical protein [Candidatus Saganbacteria bacterium]
MSGTSIVQFLGTKGRSIINKIRSPKESKIAARTKSLHDAIAYHENKAIEHLRIFNESIPKLRITLNSENPNIKYIIKNYSFTIPIAQLFLKMNYPDHLLFQDYIDGNYLLAGLDIYKGILNFKNDRLTATG